MASSQSKASPLTLYRGWTEEGNYVWSPFVTKLELRLRHGDIPYSTAAGSVKTAPKGKIPYIELSEGDCFGDSALIIKRLVKDGMLEDLNAKLSPEGRAHDIALRALLEDKLYFYHTHERWIKNFYSMRPHILSAIAYPLQVVVGHLIYTNTAKTLHGQGTGRYSDEEIAAFRLEIWENIDQLLESAKTKAENRLRDKPFWVLGGSKPSEADMTLFAFISSVLICTACPASQETIRTFPVVLDYAERIHKRYFGDYSSWD